MTQVWGPLGWMTLHSISTIYPDNPTQDDKAILKRFMKTFEETISCPTCKGHFVSISNVYKSRFPSWLDSRNEFFLYICRAHNTVNARLDKPRPQTLADSLETFKNNTVHTSASVFRQKYIQYLTQNWTKEFSGDSMMMVTLVKEMKTINDSYWNNRDDTLDSFVITQEFDVLTPIPESGDRTKVGGNIPNFAMMPNIRIGFQGGRLKLAR
jgi:hypothetical protein